MNTKLLLSAVGLLAGIGTYMVSDLPGGTNGGSRPITRAELDRHGNLSAYDVVQTLRPGWIQQYRAGDRQVVYLQTVCTTITCLRWVEADKVEEIVLLGPDAGPTPWLRQADGRGLIVRFRTRDGS